MHQISEMVPLASKVAKVSPKLDKVGQRWLQHGHRITEVTNLVPGRAMVKLSASKNPTHIGNSVGIGRDWWDPVEMRNLQVIQRFRHCLMILAAIPHQPNAYGAISCSLKILLGVEISRSGVEVSKCGVKILRCG